MIDCLQLLLVFIGDRTDLIYEFRVWDAGS